MRTKYSIFTLTLSLIALLVFTNFGLGIVEPPTPTKKAVSLKTSLDNIYYFPDKKEVYLLIDLEGGEVVQTQKRPKLNLSLVLDKSGSMSGEKLAYAKEASKFLVENLDKGDMVSVITYSNDVKILSEAKKYWDKETILNEISYVEAGGGTFLSGGMLEGYEQVKTNYDPNRINRVLLLSDGLANQGVRDRIALRQIAKNKNNTDNITISTFGIGADFNELIMTDLAEQGSGNYYFIEKSNQIQDIFNRELNNINSVVAQNSKIQVKFPTQYLQIAQVHGFPYQVKNQEIVIDLKNINAKQKKPILIKFNITKEIQEEVSFQTRLTYDTQKRKNISIFSENILKIADIMTSNDVSEQIKDSFNPDVLDAIALFEGNQSFEEAMSEVDKGNVAEAEKILKEAEKELEQKMMEISPSKSPSAELKKQQESIKKYKKAIKTYNTLPAQKQKIFQKTNRNSNYEIRNNINTIPIKKKKDK